MAKITLHRGLKNSESKNRPGIVTIFAVNLGRKTGQIGQSKPESNVMISISNISYYIGGRALYENASMFIKPKDKIGLIGLNGRGKSTLLKIIHGEYKIDSGSISKSNECTIGFLNQDLLS